MTNPPPADLSIDGGDRRCVTLLLELARHIRDDGQPGMIIHLSTTDPAAPLDLAAWCHLTGHTYLGAVDHQSQPTYALQVQTGAHDTDPNRPWHPAP